MKEWKGLIAGLLLGVLAMLAIGAATTDSNGRYQLEVIGWHKQSSGTDVVSAYMLDTRTGDLYFHPEYDGNVWHRMCSVPRGAKPDTDSAE